MAIDRKENFIRLAESRTNKILKSLELLGNLSNRSYYEYTQEQVDAIFNALQEELETQKTRFFAKEDKIKKFRL